MFCKQANEITRVLLLCWDPKVFNKPCVDDKTSEVAAANRRKSDFNPEALTAVLKCPIFYHYLKMVIKLNEIPKGISSWCEGCPCHEALLTDSSKASYFRRKALLEEFDGEDCPLKGKRGSLT